MLLSPGASRDAQGAGLGAGKAIFESRGGQGCPGRGTARRPSQSRALGIPGRPGTQKLLCRRAVPRPGRPWTPRDSTKTMAVHVDHLLGMLTCSILHRLPYFYTPMTLFYTHGSIRVVVLRKFGWLETEFAETARKSDSWRHHNWNSRAAWFTNHTYMYSKYEKNTCKAFDAMDCLERKNRQIIYNPFKSSSRRVPTIHNGWPSSNHILSMSLTPHPPFFAKPLCDFLSRDGKTTAASCIAFGFVNQNQSTVFHATLRFLPVRQSHCGIVLLWLWTRHVRVSVTIPPLWFVWHRRTAVGL
jgi:hypothetical protein